MKQKHLETSLLGAICLILGWGIGTILHECGHLAGTYAFGLPATLGQITLTTGSVFVQGDLTGTQTAVMAIAGSLWSNGCWCANGAALRQSYDAHDWDSVLV